MDDGPEWRCNVRVKSKRDLIAHDSARPHSLAPKKRPVPLARSPIPVSDFVPIRSAVQRDQMLPYRSSEFPRCSPGSCLPFFCTPLPTLVCLFSSSLLLADTNAQGSPSWQQRVEYEMDVRLDVQRHRLSGRQLLRYHNNSPDTLHRVFYHLYFNAFNPHSAMAERNRHLPDPDSRIVPRIFQLGPDEVGFHRIERLTQDGEGVEFRIEDTVMEVSLARPILPGTHARFELDFDSQIPLQTRRSGRDNLEGIDYSMTQWYPKMANYDERGWHADPYVGREFYAPFGTFDVRLTLPAKYVIGATGVLQNPEEIGHGYGDSPDGPATGSDLTWHFHAENVHDFAWSADPDYVHDVVRHDGIEHHLLYQPDVAENWVRLRQWLPAIIEFFSERYGRYPYPQVTVAQGGDGGMEYPMITLITGRRSPSSLLGVTTHELAHMWYYAVLGSNEADYAWLDEGFASYAEAEFHAHRSGSPRAPHLGNFHAVLWGHDRGLLEPMSTPSDWFRTNVGYSIGAYQSGAMVVDMLGYVMSDSLRDRFLLEYFERFKFRHPNPYDVEKVAEDVSGLSLDWFFDQFTRTTWKLDYAVGRVTNRRSGDGWDSTISIERRGDVVIPVDLLITFEDGRRQWVTIPLRDMRGHKPVPDGWIVADDWSSTSPEYRLDFVAGQRVVRVDVDPSMRTPDVNRLNNRSRIPVGFAFLEPPQATWSRYAIGWRPLIQYARNFGGGGGVQFRGTYLFDQFRTKVMLKFWPEVILSDGEKPEPSGTTSSVPNASSSWFDGIDFDLQYVDRLQQFGPYGIVSLRSEKHLGILENEISFTTPLHRFHLLTEDEHRITVGIRHQVRTTDRAPATESVSGFIPDDVLSAHATYTYTDDRTRLDVRADLGGAIDGGFGSFSANRVYVDAARAAAFGSFTAGARVRVGLGAENLITQKKYRLGASTYEERWANDAYRSIGAVLKDPLAEPGWVAFAGPGPVAYARRTVEPAGELTIDAPLGNHTAAASAVLVTNPVPDRSWLAPLQVELFLGAGEVWSGSEFIDGFSASEILFDAGVGFRYDVAQVPGLRRWTAQSDVLSSLNLTAKFPVWAGDPQGSVSANGFDFRWLIGITTDDAPWY